MASLPPLQAPDLPQMTPDNTISQHDIDVSGAVFVRITEYSDAAAGDYIKVLWDETSVDELIVGNVVGDSFPAIVLVTDELALGQHTVYYTSQDQFNNTNTSTPVIVTIIDGAPEIKYPAPIFSDAVNGVIDKASIATNNGTHIYVSPHADIVQNDTVTLYWRGVSADETIIDGDIYSHTVLANDITKGITFLAPEAKLLPLKDNASITASYQVRDNGQIKGVSKYGEATLDLNGGGGGTLNMIISTDAAPTDYSAIHVYPYNQGAIKGPAGMSIEMSITGSGAVFDDSGSAVTTVVLNQEGYASFKIKSTTTGGFIVNAHQSSDPSNKADPVSISFDNYRKGPGKILYMNSTSGAPADGNTPCSIYLKTDTASGFSPRAEITKVRVYLKNGHGEILGYPGQNPADILINADKSAEIDIVSNMDETINVEISLPEASGSDTTLTVSFSEF